MIENYLLDAIDMKEFLFQASKAGFNYEDRSGKHCDAVGVKILKVNKKDFKGLWIVEQDDAANYHRLMQDNVELLAEHMKIDVTVLLDLIINKKAVELYFVKLNEKEQWYAYAESKVKTA